jgi:hypothetical protein
MDEVPEELRHLIEDGIAQQLRSGGKSGPVVVRKTLTLHAGAGHPVPVELQAPPGNPQAYRQAVMARESGGIPELFPLESLLPWLLGLGIAGVVLALVLEARWKLPGNPRRLLGEFGGVGAAVIGLVWLWDRRRRRDLYPLLQNIAGMISGSFVVVVRSSPQLHVARDAWNGVAAFYAGSKNSPSYSRFVARIAPSPAGFRVHARRFLDRFVDTTIGETVPTGDAEFDGRFAMTSIDRNFALSMMDLSRRPALDRLHAFGNPVVEVIGGLVRVQVDRDLSRPRHADDLQGFLIDAVALVDAASRLAPREQPPAPQ